MTTIETDAKLLLRLQSQAKVLPVKAAEWSAQMDAEICRLLDAGWTQADVARVMGVSRQAVNERVSRHRKAG